MDQEQFWSRGVSKKKRLTTRNPFSHGLQEFWKMALKLLHTFQSWSGGMKYLRQCASSAERSPKVNCRQVNQILNEQFQTLTEPQKWKGILHHLLAGTKRWEGAVLYLKSEL